MIDSRLLTLSIMFQLNKQNITASGLAAKRFLKLPFGSKEAKF